MKKYLFILALSALVACKKDKSADISIDSVTISTIEPIYKSDGNIKTGGKVSLDLNKDFLFTYGVCYGLDQNPTLSDLIENNNIANGFEFESVIYNNFDLDKSIYIRAYLKDKNGKIKYGNQVIAKRELNLKVNIIKNIQVDQFTIDFTLDSKFTKINSSGFCYSELPNPTIENSTIRYNPDNGTGTFTLNSFDNLSPKKTYYVRAFVKNDYVIYYSEQKTVKLAGYTGETGGVVIFDKGIVSDGWRYLEASKSKLTYASNVEFKWSCNNNPSVNISTDTELGTGDANSIAMSQTCNYSNNAATAALNLVRDGVEDWYLPSLDEMSLLAKAADKHNLVYLGSSGYWTSSQVNQTDAYVLYGYLGYSQQAYFKNTLFNAWPIRKY